MKYQTKARLLKDKFGNLMLDFNKVEYRKALEELKEGSYVLVSISDQRTVLQNNLLHKLLSEISAYTGEGLDDLKCFFKHKFLGYVEHEVTDYQKECDEEDCWNQPVKKVIKELRSTTSLTKKEFGDFVTQIQAWSWENLSLNLSNIPDD